ncbi:MAG: tetratricopeptide repeat protein [Pseudomonadota bacterium]
MIPRKNALVPLFFCGIVLWTLLLAYPAAADSVTTKTYNKLTEAQELMGEEDIAGAITILEELRGSVKEDSLDKALTLQMLGYARMSEEKFADAVVLLKQSLALDKLPEQVKYNVGYMVAQLHAALGEFDQALDFAAEWFTTLEDPTPSQMMFMANIYAQTKRYEEAIPYAEMAVAGATEPKESWYQLLTAAHFELKQYNEAATTLQRIIAQWPEQSSYWEQLASVYVVLEDEPRALATLKIAWLQGRLEKSSSIKSMVQLAVARGIPEQAARLIEAAFEADLLERDADHVKLLANAWVSAREYQPAVIAFSELAELEDSGEPLLRVANLHIEQGRWDQAEDTLRTAIDKGLPEPGKAWLLLGISLAEQQSYKESFAALRKARSFDATRRQATKWLGYAEDMRKQEAWQRSYRGS